MSAECDNPPVAEASNPAEGNGEVAEESEKVSSPVKGNSDVKENETEASPPQANTNSTTSADGSPKKSPTSRAAESGFHHHVVMTDKSGALNVYVQGDLEDAHKDKDSKTVFITCHDIGNNHYSFSKFIASHFFDDIRKRAVFVHVDLPGQEDDAEDMGDDTPFPTMQALGEDLITVLDQLRIKYCIGIGDGAGANVMIRFGMMHVTRVLGVILLHPTANASTMMESFKNSFSKWQMKHINASAENIVAFRKFGHKLEDKEDKEKALEEYKEKLKHKVNSKNMSKFAKQFQKRTDIHLNLKDGLKCDALVVVGTKSHAHLHAAEYMHSHMDKTRTSLLKVDDVGNAMDESPEKLAKSILLFCKGLGFFTSVDLPGVDRRSSQDKLRSNGRQCSISMEDYDKPNIRRLSVSSKE
jgi:predicted esterase